MDWQVSRTASVLWRYVQELKEDADSSIFYDLTVHCSDGLLAWNRLHIGISLPSCAALLAPEVPETEVALSLPDLTVGELRKLLEEQLPKTDPNIHPSLLPKEEEVSYKLVERRPVTPPPPSPSPLSPDAGPPSPDAGDFFGSGPPSDVESANESQEISKKRKKSVGFADTSSDTDNSENESLLKRSARKKKDKKHPMVKINKFDIKMEPDENGTKKKKKRKKKIIKMYNSDDDFDLAFDMALKGSDASSDEEVATSSKRRLRHVDLDVLRESVKLTMDCMVTVINYELTEDQLEDRVVQLRKTRERGSRTVKEENMVPDVKMEPQEPETRVVVDAMECGGAEEEAIEKHITRYRTSLGRLVKQCNSCEYSTERMDKTTMKEHLFKHFPDLCGIACPVCRKTWKRKRDLILHMERIHAADVLMAHGIEYMKQYEVAFDTNSEEQVRLRTEEYCQSDCSNCKQTFFSAERVKAHVELGFCIFAEARVKVFRPQYIFKGEHFDEERKKLNQLGSDSESEVETRRRDSSEDEDFDPKSCYGGRFNGTPGTSNIEQTQIFAGMDGLMEDFSRGPPYKCIIPSCEQRGFPTRTTMRRHYISHDPEMFSTLVCPICKFCRPEDHPGEMTKHIVDEHNKEEEWAKDNVIVEVSESLQLFREETIFSPKGRVVKRRGRPPGPGGPKRKFIGLSSLKERVRGKRCEISLDDPAIKASFEEGGGGGGISRWFCGVPQCKETFRLAYELKRHYMKHDKTLFNKMRECNSCSYSTHTIQRIQKHLEEEHPDQLFLEDTGEKQYSTATGKRWQDFSDQANILIEANPNHNGKEWENRQEVFPTIEATCQECKETFNTQNSFEDHAKVHNPELIRFTCEKCDEGFAVESVYNNHIKSHLVLYTSLRAGPIRCNGCSQHFQRVIEVKKHMSIHHHNLLVDCHFCEQCTDFFTFKHSLRNHMFTHAAEVFRCPVCPMKFLDQKEKDDHVAKGKCKAKEMNHVCTLCGRRFVSPLMLETHIKKVHENILQYQCNICQMLYENTALIERHIRASHKLAMFGDSPITNFFTFLSPEEAKLLDVEKLNANKPKGRPGERSAERFECPFGCGGMFKKSGLTRHKKVCMRSTNDYKVTLEDDAEIDKTVADMMEPSSDPETGKRVWKCKQCDYTNKLRFTVKAHVETHISGQSHQCPNCDRVCPTRNALRVHILRNHDAKTTPIPKNPDIDKQISEMATEMVEHHDDPDRLVCEMMEPSTDPDTGGMLWQCTHCDYAERDRLTVKDHVMGHIAGEDGEDEEELEIELPIGGYLETGEIPMKMEMHEQQHQNGNSQEYPMALSMKVPKAKPVKARSQMPYQLSSQQQMIHKDTVQIHTTHKDTVQIQMIPKPKPPRSDQQHRQPPSAPRQPPAAPRQPPSAHMNHPMINHPLMAPMSPFRNYFDDNTSQHSEENNITFAEDTSITRQQLDPNRQQLPPVDNIRQNPQNPYGLPGYGLPIWPFYRQ